MMVFLKKITGFLNRPIKPISIRKQPKVKSH
jgi:hypothetical protein